ncbi:MAG: hypothetical protein PHV59_12460, partial [Victivallales bacterium]|nr:hypothetical protein [Victivallales bacterium]
GGDRQALHEAIRVHSMDAAKRIKEEGGDNDLLERLKADPVFAGVAGRIDELVDPRAFIGRAPEQAEEFLNNQIYPLFERMKEEMADDNGEAINV